MWSLQQKLDNTFNISITVQSNTQRAISCHHMMYMHDAGALLGLTACSLRVLTWNGRGLQQGKDYVHVYELLQT